MIEKVKKISNKKIVITTLCLMLVILLLGFTYAYWTMNFTQSGVNTNTYDSFELTFSENIEGVTQANSYPQTDADGLTNNPYEVTITNTCNIAASYNVILNKINTSTLDDSHIKVAVNNDIKLLSEASTVETTIENAIEGKIINMGVLAGKDSKTIQVRSWMEQNTTIEEGSNKSFAYKITIESTAGSKLLANIVLTNNKIGNTSPTADAFYYGEPNPNPDYTKNIPNTYNKKYEGIVNTTSLALPLGRYLGTGYSYDQKTGLYNLTGKIKKSDLTTSPVNYYMCSINSGRNCYVMYKILEYDGSRVTKSIKYEVGQFFTDNTMFTAEDNDGTSYYYRGEIENNYVSFANKLWRIVRINGDGTIRLILNDVSGETIQFNAQTDNEKYVGYTYDNESACTANNPCISEYNQGTKTFTNNKSVTNSTIKEYLENTWYQNIAEYDDYIALGNYCNDTTNIVDESTTSQTYQFYQRKENKAPILKCLDTSELYGGYYKSKIGLITSDEMALAGFGTINTANSTFNYLYFNEAAWGMTPYQYYNQIPLVLTGIYSSFWTSLHSNATVNNQHALRPVINLKNDVKVASGDGTKDNPFIIK